MSQKVIKEPTQEPAQNAPKVTHVSGRTVLLSFIILMTTVCGTITKVGLDWMKEPTVEPDKNTTLTLQEAPKAEKKKPAVVRAVIKSVDEYRSLIKASMLKLKQIEQDAEASEKKARDEAVQVNLQRKKDNLAPLPIPKDMQAHCSNEVAWGFKIAVEKGSLGDIATVCHLNGQPLGASLAVALIESSLNPSKKHEETLAASLYQILPETALFAFKKYGADLLPVLQDMNVSEHVQKEIKNFVKLWAEYKENAKGGDKKKKSEFDRVEKEKIIKLSDYPRINAFFAHRLLHEAETANTEWNDANFNKALEQEGISIRKIFPSMKALGNNWGDRGANRLVFFALTSPDMSLRAAHTEVLYEGFIMHRVDKEFDALVKQVEKEKGKDSAAKIDEKKEKKKIEEALPDDVLIDFREKSERRAATAMKQNKIPNEMTVGEYFVKKLRFVRGVEKEFEKKCILLVEEGKQVPGLQAYFKGKGINIGVKVAQAAEEVAGKKAAGLEAAPNKGPVAQKNLKASPPPKTLGKVPAPPITKAKVAQTQLARRS